MTCTIVWLCASKTLFTIIAGRLDLLTLGLVGDRLRSTAFFTEYLRDPVQSLPWPQFSHLYDGEPDPCSNYHLG